MSLEILSDYETLTQLLSADGIDIRKFGLGSLCKWGHAYKTTDKSLRRLRNGKTGTCNECIKIYAERNKIDYSNLDCPRRLRAKESARKSRKKHLEKHVNRVKRWRANNADRFRDQRRLYEGKNRERIRKARRLRLWGKESAA